MRYDLVIRGGHVLDPALGIDRITSVAVKDNKIAAVGDEIDANESERVIDASGQYVTPGWFDMHVHAYSHLAFSHPDTIGVLQGVPTMLDAGGAGAWTYDDCRAYWEGRCKTDIFAFVMYNAAGIYTGSQAILDVETNNALEVPVEDWKDVIGRNIDRIKMVKSAAITRLGFTPVAAAQQISEASGVPIYMHVGDIGDFGNQPKHMTIITREVMDMLRPGDIVTHVYTGNWGNLLDDRGNVYPEVVAARKRGVLFDVGFGGLNFGFEAYDKLLHQGIVTDVISSDLQGVNITGPAHSLAHVMSLFLNFGLTLRDVVERVTINPAKSQGLDHMIGSLTAGYPARITVFGIEEGEYTFRDCEGGKRTGSRMIRPQFCVMDGEVIESDFEAGIVQENWSFMPAMEDIAPNAGALDGEQREFAHALADDYKNVNWNDGRGLHSIFKQRIESTGIDARRASDAVYDLLLESRFCVPMGWMLNGLEKDETLRRLTAA
jgi:dihydroorotase